MLPSSLTTVKDRRFILFLIKFFQVPEWEKGSDPNSFQLAKFLFMKDLVANKVLMLHFPSE